MSDYVWEKGMMGMNRFTAALFSIFIGISMMSVWILFYVTGSIPELETAPAQIAAHLAAEFVTAVLLIVGGLAMIKDKSWGLNLYLFSMGMLVYTLIQSPGYYLQLGDMAMTGMFAVFLVISLWFLVPLIAKKQSI